MKKHLFLVLVSALCFPFVVWADEPCAELCIAPAKYDLGTIHRKDKRTLSFEYANKGDAPLVIVDVDVSCGCVVPEWSKEPLLPGQSAVMTVEFDPKTKMGTTINSIYIRSTAKNSLEVVRIYAVVKK
ncbi:MAG: DUF1573 domain-containing protein [Alistipes sp.]|nr:DUF1573 domain-containing protein [Alistipes sp.]MDE6778764.1 DUF1573 domain-containing protein [Alistipes sp.]